MDNFSNNQIVNDLDFPMDSELLNSGLDDATFVPVGYDSTETIPLSNKPKTTYSQALSKSQHQSSENNHIIHTIGTREERLADLEIQRNKSYHHQNQPNFYNLIFPGIDISRDVNVFKLETELNEKLFKPKISKHSKNALLVEITSPNQRNALLKTKKILDIAVEVRPDPILSTTRGIVKSKTMTYLSNEELTNKLSSQGVSNVLRINDTNVFIVTFQTSTLPALIKLTDWHYEPVEIYAPAPMRCKKCQKLGHTHNQCRNEHTPCPKCTQNGHTAKDCSNVAFCINCGKDHPSSDSNCPHYLMRKEMLKIQLTEKISFREAKSKVRVKYAREGKQYIFEVKCPVNPIQGINEQNNTEEQLETINHPDIQPDANNNVTDKKIENSDNSTNTNKLSENTEQEIHIVKNSPIMKEIGVEVNIQAEDESKDEISNANQTEPTQSVEMHPVDSPEKIISKRTRCSSDEDNSIQLQKPNKQTKKKKAKPRKQ